MRMLIHVKLPAKEFNVFVKDRSIGGKIKKILDDIKPDAVYFTEYCGRRGLIMIADVAGPSAVPVIAEPWFLLFNADVEFHIVMSPDELEESGLDALGKKWAYARRASRIQNPESNAANVEGRRSFHSLHVLLRRRLNRLPFSCFAPISF